MTITGLDDALRNLKELPKALRRKAAVVVRESATAATESMKQLAPEKTGLLKRNIFSDIRGTSGWVRIGVDAWYWHMLEFGTINMPAKPFIRPAAELEAPNFQRGLEAVAREIEEGNAT
jgi:HK97 gp10 family phage protein